MFQSVNLAKGMLRSFTLPIQRGMPRINGAGQSPAPFILGLEASSQVKIQEFIGGALHRQ